MSAVHHLVQRYRLVVTLDLENYICFIITKFFIIRYWTCFESFFAPLTISPNFAKRAEDRLRGWLAVKLKLLIKLRVEINHHVKIMVFCHCILSLFKSVSANVFVGLPTHFLAEEEDYRGLLGQDGSCCKTLFKTLGRAFQTLGWAFDFLLRLQKLSRVFGKLVQAFERLGRVFWNKHLAECFVEESLWKSGL